MEILAKASVIVADHDCVFLQTRVLTDVRAIFGPDPEALPSGAAVTHMLAIAYQHNGNRESFYLALSSGDIAKLVDTLNRALSKEKGLKKLLEKANVPFLESE